MGRVHDITVENFKSYQGRIQIGPFRKFTCVIGPNGAGKSNLMDAISFVLGVQARVLRGGKLRDLVYRKEGEEPAKNQRTASVELTYVGEGESEDEEVQIIFRRLILRTGEARFQVNGETISQADYTKRLEAINILSKARNFLVFQGDVEATAQRQGKDLTAFFEQISGSDSFRQDYERLAEEKSKKEDNARYLFTKKRNAMNEKKRVAHQKAEADSYRRMEKERKDLQREFYLFRLHGISRQLEEAADKREASERERTELHTATEQDRKALEKAERQKAQAHLEATKAERAVAATRLQLDKLHPERVAARTRIDFIQQRIQDLHSNAEQLGRKTERTREQLQHLHDESAKLEAEEKALADHLAQCGLHFTKQQREEFERVKRKTERITADGGEAARQLEHQVSVLAAERNKTESDQREALAKQEHLQSRLAELGEAEEAARSSSKQEAQRAEQRRAELHRLEAATASCAEEKVQLQVERQELLDTIEDTAATEKQLERERQQLQVCKDLAAAVRGVYGRVIDLCQPTQKRLHVATNVALAKFIDAIIVDRSVTARSCVKFLKERMLPPMTFLPLDDLRAQALDPRLAKLVNEKKTLRLALDCVNFDERHKTAFDFLLGDVVFADSMGDGRRLAFQEARNLGISCKVVTLQGEAIAKNGNLSVDSGAAREGSTRFDMAELEGKKSRVATIDRRLQEIQTLAYNGGADLATLKNEFRKAEGKASETSARLRWCQEQLKVKREELRQAKESLEALGPETARLAGEEARVKGELENMEARLSEAVAGHFAKLSKAMGVDDVRKVEREWRREEEAAQLKSEDLSRRLRNSRAEASMLEQTLREQEGQRPQELAPKLQAEVDDLHQKERDLAQSINTLEDERKRHHQQANEAAALERDRDQALQGLRRACKDQRLRLTALERQLGELNSQEQVLGNARADVLRQSVLEDVEVPLITGGLQALQDLAEAASQSASAPTQGPGAAVLAADSLAVDFSSLPEEKQQASSGPASKMLEEEYRSELERLRVELKRLSPNLKAAEQMHGVDENVHEASREADVARKDIESVEVEFEAVRKARRERFMNCFKKVAEEIGEVYRRLTSNTAGLHSDGGSAYLDLEDTEDGFNGGIKFTAMPPAKRFRDMHLLSGGEKTLAAMALLFAVHAYQRPPFMVLDEVDAALDANNVRALAGYVEQAHCQTIVISLKDRFFIRGDALVGVWKDKPQETSAVLTLDLTRYEPAQA